jgi:hypothetical protein
MSRGLAEPPRRGVLSVFGNIGDGPSVMTGGENARPCQRLVSPLDLFA